MQDSPISHTHTHTLPLSLSPSLGHFFVVVFFSTHMPPVKMAEEWGDHEHNGAQCRDLRHPAATPPRSFFLLRA